MKKTNEEILKDALNLRDVFYDLQEESIDVIFEDYYTDYCIFLACTVENDDMSVEEEYTTKFLENEESRKDFVLHLYSVLDMLTDTFEIELRVNHSIHNRHASEKGKVIYDIYNDYRDYLLANLTV